MGQRVLANFEAGKVDTMSSFSVSQKLYGRDKEITMLRGALRRVAVEGTTEVAITFSKLSSVSFEEAFRFYRNSIILY